MKHASTARKIMIICIAFIAAFSAFALWRAFRPSEGLPYEQVTYDKAMEFMEYESGYAIVDIRLREEYEHSHVKGAENLPYDTIVESAIGLFPDKTQTIYVYGENNEQSAKGCLKLTELGYSSITQILDPDTWYKEAQTEQES